MTDSPEIDMTHCKKRLLMLADFLDNLPEERFDYSHWAGDNWGGKSDLSCGTTACALGWATTIPELAEAGLVMHRPASHHDNEEDPLVCLRARVGTIDPRFDCLSKFPEEAARQVFGLSKSEYEWLFIPNTFHKDVGSPSRYATAKEVATHIRKFAATKD